MEQTTWWKLRVQTDNAEELAYETHELGASGVVFLADNEFEAYVEGSRESAEQIARVLRERGAKVRESESVPDENWVEKCHEIWKPVTVGSIRLIPVPDSDSQNIFLIPGMGFGTGHHESTRLALSLMEALRGRPMRKILDLGTGNGVLSFAASLSFDARILALDIDENSLMNARANLKLNPRCKNIEFRIGKIEEVEGPFDLICANIYAEVLEPIVDEMVKKLSPKGYLILSGIYDETAHIIERSYPKKFQLLEKRTENEWCAYLFQLTNRAA